MKPEYSKSMLMNLMYETSKRVRSNRAAITNHLGDSNAKSTLAKITFGFTRIATAYKYSVVGLLVQNYAMVERFNGRIADTLKTPHFQPGEELEHNSAMIHVDLYNSHLPQANLNCRTPCQIMLE